MPSNHRHFKSQLAYYQFAKPTQSARYFHSEEAHEFLETLLEHAQQRRLSFAAGEQVWRSQLGCVPQSDPRYRIAIPYPKERMKPRSDGAHEGRVNPKGIPCLYVSSNMDTSIAEVRPISDNVASVGLFQIVRDLLLLDATKSIVDYPLHNEPSDDPCILDDLAWAHLGFNFSMPASQDPMYADYVPTQVIAEFFKRNGFDGIAYQSGVCSGINYALFDLNAARLLSCTAKRIVDVKYVVSPGGNSYVVNDSPSKA